MEDTLLQKAITVSKLRILANFIGTGLAVITVFIVGVLLPFFHTYRCIDAKLMGWSTSWFIVAVYIAVLLAIAALWLSICTVIGASLIESLKLLSLTINTSYASLELKTNAKTSTIDWQNIIHTLDSTNFITFICNPEGEVRIIRLERNLFGPSRFQELTASLRTFTHVTEDPQEIQKIRKQYDLQNLLNKRKIRLSKLLR